MGKFCFLLRKKHKVQIEVDLYSTVYNLKRLINIDNMHDLIDKVENMKRNNKKTTIAFSHSL